MTRPGLEDECWISQRPRQFLEVARQAHFGSAHPRWSSPTHLAWVSRSLIAASLFARSDLAWLVLAVAAAVVLLWVLGVVAVGVVAVAACPGGGGISMCVGGVAAPKGVLVVRAELGSRSDWLVDLLIERVRGCRRSGYLRPGGEPIERGWS